MSIENVGPHDPELVDFVMAKVNQYLDGPMAEHLNTNIDFLNDVVDGVNNIFSEEIELAWMYRGLE